MEIFFFFSLKGHSTAQKKFVKLHHSVAINAFGTSSARLFELLSLKHFTAPHKCLIQVACSNVGGQQMSDIR